LGIIETELVAAEQVLGRLGNKEMERSENNVRTEEDGPSRPLDESTESESKLVMMGSDF
jgi:hypothetical protein